MRQAKTMENLRANTKILVDGVLGMIGDDIKTELEPLADGTAKKLFDSVETFGELVNDQMVKGMIFASAQSITFIAEQLVEKGPGGMVNPATGRIADAVLDLTTHLIIEAVVIESMFAFLEEAGKGPTTA